MKETQTYRPRRRASATVKSGQVSSSCQRRTIACWSSGERAAIRFSASNLSSVAMHVVYIECGIDGADHPVQRAAAVFVSKFVPTVLDAAPRATVLQCSYETAVPTEDRSPVPKASTLTANISRLPLLPPHACGRHHEIGDDQPQPLVILRQQ